MDELFTPVEAAEYLKVTRAAIYKWIKEGKLAVVYVGSDRRITKSAIEAFIAASTAEGLRKKPMDSDATLEGTDSPQTPGRAAQLALTPA